MYIRTEDQMYGEILIRTDRLSWECRLVQVNDVHIRF
jgi:hypothetical protein